MDIGILLCISLSENVSYVNQVLVVSFFIIMIISYSILFIPYDISSSSSGHQMV